MFKTNKKTIAQNCETMCARGEKAPHSPSSASWQSGDRALSSCSPSGRSVSIRRNGSLERSSSRRASPPGHGSPAETAPSAAPAPRALRAFPRRSHRDLSAAPRCTTARRRREARDRRPARLRWPNTSGECSPESIRRPFRP